MIDLLPKSLRLLVIIVLAYEVDQVTENFHWHYIVPELWSAK